MVARAFLLGGLGGLAIGLVGYGLEAGIRHRFGLRESICVAAGVTIGVGIALMVRNIKKARDNEEKA